MSLNSPTRDRLFHRRTLGYRPVALALTALLLIACQPVETLMTTGTEDPASVTSSDAIGRTEQRIGTVMTIRAKPITKVSPQTFTVQDEEVFGTEPILAINASGVPVIVPTDTQTPLQITGTVVRFIATDIERAYGFELDPNLYAEYEGKPTIIRQSPSHRNPLKLPPIRRATTITFWQSPEKLLQWLPQIPLD